MNHIWNVDAVPLQHERTAIVTGANVGLGFETAKALAGKGFEIILAARNKNKAEETKQIIRLQYPEARLTFIPLDLSRLSSVREFAAEVSEKYTKLDLLINNAGIMAPPYTVTEDGFESQFGTNYLGHFLLTGLLLPLMKNVTGSRVVSVSSIAHKYGDINFNDLHFKKSYNKIKAYSQSKLASLMFSYELQRRLNKSGYRTISVAAHPGVSSTNLGKNMSPVLRYFFPRIGQAAEAGALPILRAAIDNKVMGEEYYGPDGFLEMRGNPIKVGSSKISRDPVKAARLWEVSEKLVNFSFHF